MNTDQDIKPKLMCPNCNHAGPFLVFGYLFAIDGQGERDECTYPGSAETTLCPACGIANEKPALEMHAQTYSANAKPVSDIPSDTAYDENDPYN